VKGSDDVRSKPWIAVVVALAAAGCGVSGSGVLVSQTRDVTTFDRIDVTDGVVLSVSVDPGAPVSVSATYDDDLIDMILTVVDGTTLVVSADGKIAVGDEGRLVEVSVPTLSALIASAGARVSGSGDLESLSVEATGGATVDLSRLTTRTMALDASGGADVTVNVSDVIEGKVDGGAKATVIGAASVEGVEVSGGGSLGD
jgi:hypothetical protein